MAEYKKAYMLFNEKLPASIEDLNPINKKMVTFFNPFSIKFLKENEKEYEKFDFLCSDGILPLFLNRLFFIKKSQRLSFDFSSVAKVVFPKGIEQGLTFYFLGSTEESIKAFKERIKKMYPKLKIIGVHHGYIKNIKDDVLTNIITKEPNVVVVGMGTPFQDFIAIELREKGFKGAIYTCGGFFHQAAVKPDYFPKWVNKFHLRIFLRLIKEPHTRKRIFINYPLFIYQYLLFLFMNSSKLRKL